VAAGLALLTASPARAAKDLTKSNREMVAAGKWRDVLNTWKDLRLGDAGAARRFILGHA